MKAELFLQQDTVMQVMLSKDNEITALKNQLSLLEA
jgi:hypothetical protein